MIIQESLNEQILSIFHPARSRASDSLARLQERKYITIPNHTFYQGNELSYEKI
jgi:hypothetical protein